LAHASIRMIVSMLSETYLRRRVGSEGSEQ